MTEQQACTLCGAGGHTAANCIWNGSEKGLALVQRIDKNLAERAQFESWVRREWPGAPLHHVRDALPVSDPRYGEYCNENIQRGWVGWQARAALEQPSPATELERPEVTGWRDRILNAHPSSDPRYWPDALLVQHMTAEIAELRAILPKQPPAQDLEHVGSLISVFRNAIRDDANNGGREYFEKARSAEQELRQEIDRIVGALRAELAMARAAQAGQVPEGYRLIRVEHFDQIKASLDPEQVDAYRGRNVWDDDKVYANWRACDQALDQIRDIFQQIEWDAENDLPELLAAAPAQGGE